MKRNFQKLVGLKVFALNLENYEIKEFSIYRIQIKLTMLDPYYIISFKPSGITRLNLSLAEMLVFASGNYVMSQTHAFALNIHALDRAIREDKIWKRKLRRKQRVQAVKNWIASIFTHK